MLRPGPRQGKESRTTRRRRQRRRWDCRQSGLHRDVSQGVVSWRGDDVGDGVVEEEGVEERAAALEGEGDAVAAEVTEDLDSEGRGSKLVAAACGWGVSTVRRERKQQTHE